MMVSTLTLGIPATPLNISLNKFKLENLNSSYGDNIFKYSAF